MVNIKNIKGNTYFLNCFTNIGLFIKDGIATLIDSGLDDEAAMEIDEALQNENIKLTNIILTHAHSDHMGGANYFQTKYNCKVLTTLADTAIANLSIMNTSLIYGGLPINIAKGKMLYSKSCHATLLRPENIPDGIEIVDLRGHSINMIGVKTEDNVFFIADSVISEKTINKYPLTYILDIENHLKALEKVENSNCDYYVPSHSEVTSDIKPLIELNKKSIEQNCIDILSVLTKPLEVSDIVYEYCKKFNYTLKTSQFFVSTSTLKNYLAYLDKIGKVEGYIENNRLYFKKVE